MDSDNVMSVQNEIRQNSEDLQKYLLELECWEREMKKKEEEIKILSTTPAEVVIPPVRNLLYRSKKKNRHKKQKDKNGANKTQLLENGAPDNFDPENESKEQFDEMIHTGEVAEYSSDHEEELENLRRQQNAYLHKEKGNEFFKKGNYDSAVNSYTAGIMLDPENPLLLANRAMAFLKKEQFQAAENDCSASLSFDPTYVKAYLRRGTARKKLNKLSLAKEDFSKALELEPENKQAQSELKNFAEISPDKCSDSIPETGDHKAQEIRPQFSENKIIKCTREKLEADQASDFFTANNACIFPDSISILPLESSNLKSNLGPEIEVEVKEMDENTFVKTVEERINSLEESSCKSNLSSEMDAVNINFKLPLPPVPTTSFQFIADWNEISQNPEYRYKYLKQFPPEKLPVVFKHYMEPVIFPTLLETLCTSFLQCGDDVFDYMKYLADIGRFSTTLMFLSEKEETDLNKLLECVKSSNRPESEIADVLKKYRA